MLIKYLVYIIFLSSFISNYNLFAHNELKEITLPSNITLTLEAFDHEELPSGKGFKNRLILSSNGKSVNVIAPPIFEELNHGLFHYFAPVRKNEFYSDLNNDGNLEVAIVATSKGNAMFVPAYIYSLVSNELKLYKIGQYNQEGKWPIVFGCKKCNRWNLNSSQCNRCLQELTYANSKETVPSLK